MAHLVIAVRYCAIQDYTYVVRLFVIKHPERSPLSAECRSKARTYYSNSVVSLEVAIKNEKRWNTAPLNYSLYATFSLENFRSRASRRNVVVVTRLPYTNYNLPGYYANANTFLSRAPHTRHRLSWLISSRRTLRRYFAPRKNMYLCMRVCVCVCLYIYEKFSIEVYAWYWVRASKVYRVSS